MDKLSILIVEDDTIIAADLEASLRKNGVQSIASATTYEEMLTAIKGTAPDLVLMDINLQGKMIGVDFAKELRQQHDIPSIFITSYTDDQTIKAAALAEPMGYIIKPFKRDDIRVHIELAKQKLKNKKHQITMLTNGYRFDHNFNTLLDKDDKVINLGRNEKKLLKLLIASKNTVLTEKQITHEIYYEKPISASTIRTLIYRLRQKVGEDVLETVNGLGCKLKHFDL